MKKITFSIGIALLLILPCFTSCNISAFEESAASTTRAPDTESSNGHMYGIGNGNAYGNAQGNGHSYGYGNGYSHSPIDMSMPVHISGGYEHTSVLLADSSVWTFGDNSFGQLGIGNTVDSNIPHKIMDGGYQVSSGPHHTEVYLRDGSIWGFGENIYGQLGVGDFLEHTVPTLVSSISDVKQLEAAFLHTMYLKNDGTIWVTGNNINDNMHVDIEGHVDTPVYLEHLNICTMVAYGEGHLLTLHSDGTVEATGGNYYGQLGLNQGISNTLYPIQIPGIERAMKVAAGGWSSFILLEDGSVLAFGENFNGKLGIGSTDWRVYQPTIIQNIPEIADIASGYNHTLLLDSSGKVWVAGDNSFGQLGIPDLTSSTTPVQLDLEHVTDIACGAYHSIVVCEDGSVYTFGNNSSGQLGLGHFEDTFEPALVTF